MPPTSASLLRPFFFFFFDEAAGASCDAVAGSFGAVCGPSVACPCAPGARPGYRW